MSNSEIQNSELTPVPSGQKEQRTHSSALLPYSIYDCRIPALFPNVPMHWHSEFELDYVLDGEGEFICGDEKHVGVPGDLFLVTPNMLHSAYPTARGALTYTALVFHADMLGLYSDDRSSNACIRPLVNGTMHLPTRYDRSHPDYEIIHSLTDTAFRTAAHSTPHGDLLLKSSLLHLFWLFEQDLEPESAGKESDLIRPALEYMTFHYMDPLTVAQLSSMCHISSSHFMTQFKRIAGCSCIEFLTHLRIKAACDGLREGSDSIAEVAFQNGFFNLSNFNRQFKKVMGISPREYRSRF